VLLTDLCAPHVRLRVSLRLFLGRLGVSILFIVSHRQYCNASTVLRSIHRVFVPPLVFLTALYPIVVLFPSTILRGWSSVGTRLRPQFPLVLGHVFLISGFLTATLPSLSSVLNASQFLPLIFVRRNVVLLIVLFFRAHSSLFP